MTDNINKIDYIKTRLKQLIIENRRLSESEKQLLAERDRMIKESTELKQQIAILEKRAEALSIASGMSINAEERKAAQSKVKKILREIDSCIALINKEE